MAYTAAIGVRKAAAIEKLRCQTGRVEAAEGRLSMRRVGEPEGPDPPVAPTLL